MSVIFSIELEARRGSVWWFRAKERYDIKINTDTGAASCDCTAGTFRIGGGKLRECKHIKRARKLVALMISKKRKVV